MVRKIFLLTFIWVLAISVSRLVAQTIYISPTGNDANSGTSPAEPKRSLQSAVLNVPANGTIQVLPGTYNGGFSVQSTQRNTPFTIQGAANPGDPKPTISLRFGPTNQRLFYLDNIPNISIRGLRLEIDKTFCLNGIYAIGNINGLSLSNLDIVAMASDSNRVSGGLGQNYEAITIDGGPAGTPTPPQVTISAVTITPTITSSQGSTFFFNRGILLRSVSGTVGGASPALACTITAQRDILTQFIKGTLTIQNNQLRGGGIDVTLPDATGNVQVKDNTFTIDPRVNFLLQEAILLKHNANAGILNVEGNTIQGHTNVGVRAAGIQNATIRRNIFIPQDSAQNYRHIEVNTLWEGSTQTPVVSNSISIVGNEFREALNSTGGIAINLKNERKGAARPAPDFTGVTIGGAGADANVFDGRIRKYVVLDGRPGRTFNLDLDLSQNQFKISGTPELPSAMSQVNLLTLEDKFDHNIDHDSVGLVRVKSNELYVTPQSFFRPFTNTPSIQRAIARSAPNDVVNIKDTTYVLNPVVIDKPLVFSMPGPLTSIEALTIQTPLSTDRLTLYNQLRVRNQVTFQTGKIKIGRNDFILTVPGPTNPIGQSANSYVVTDSAGHLKYDILVNTALQYPIGTDTAYRPVTMSNQGVNDAIGLRIQSEVLSQATTGAPVDTVVGYTWFVEENTPGGSSLTFTPLWFQSDEKPEFLRESAFVQRFAGGRWQSFEDFAQPASGTNPYTITQDSIQDVLSDLPLRVFGPEDIRDTIYYVDGQNGQDNAPLISGRSPDRAWKTIQYAVNTARRVAPSGIIHIRVKDVPDGYSEAVTIPSRQSLMSLRGGFDGDDPAPQWALPAGSPVLLTVNSDSLILEKFNMFVSQVAGGGRGIVLDSNSFFAIMDSLRINSGQTNIAGSGIVSLQAEPGRTRRLLLTATNISPAAAGGGFATGISGASLSGVIGGRRGLVNNGITAPTTLDLFNLTGDSLVVARNTLLGDVSIKVSTANLSFSRNIIEGNTNIEGYAGAGSTVRIDSNSFSKYETAGLYSANNRTSLIRNNTFLPEAGISPFTSLQLNSEFSAPIPAGANYVTQDATIQANTFNGNDVFSGPAILLSHSGAGSINPGFGSIVMGGANALANTFNEEHTKFIRLDPRAGFEFPYPVDARENLFGINGQAKRPLAMTQSELFLLENKIDHTVDYSPLGFVRVRDQKTYVTQASFIPSFTSRPAIQRAVNPADENDEVNIEDFNYADTVTITKSLTFQSSGDQTQSNTLIMNGVGKQLNLARNYTLSGNLLLTDGWIRLQNNSLILTETANAAQGGNPGSFVITQANGALVQRNIGPGAKADSITYPIGTSTSGGGPSSYLPISIRNTGTVDEFSFRVFPDNLANGLAGQPEDSVVSATWVINEGIPGGATLNITPQWNQSDEKLDFDRSRSIVQGYFGNKWDFFASRSLKPAQGGNPYWVSEPGIEGRQFANMPLRVYSYLPANILYIPSLFSPNDDGRNDRFLLYSQVLGSIKFEIFNRYGNKVFESSDTQKLTTEGWDGRVNGKPLNTGTYVWRISGTFRDGRPVESFGKTIGEITLIR